MNSFGHIFRISMYGESHGKSLGVLIDGCPSGIALNEKDFAEDLERRKGGKKGTTSRREPDRPHILSGVFRNRTTGSPILIFFENTDTKPRAYEAMKDAPRPGHADFVARVKYGGFHDYRGGGHLSGRVTLGLVAAGVLAKKIIHPVAVRSRLAEAAGETDIDGAVSAAIKKKNSIGGVVECEAENIPLGLGEPFFDSVESLLSHIIFAIPAVRAIEFGSGFQAARMTGSEHNDVYIDKEGRTRTNHAGGINGGITNGNPLFFRVAVKPTPSIPQPQQTIDLRTGQKRRLSVSGRHDTCIALRVPVIVEAAVAIVLADLMALVQKVPRVVT